MNLWGCWETRAKVFVIKINCRLWKDKWRKTHTPSWIQFRRPVIRGARSPQALMRRWPSVGSSSPGKLTRDRIPHGAPISNTAGALAAQPGLQNQVGRARHPNAVWLYLPVHGPEPEEATCIRAHITASRKPVKAQSASQFSMGHGTATVVVALAMRNQRGG